MIGKISNARRSSCLELDRGDGFILDPAWDDAAKILKARCAVDGEAMHRDPAPDPHPDRAKLSLADPRAIEALDAACDDAVARRDLDHRLLEARDVFTNVAAIGVEIDDGVADKLPRAMIGHIAAPPGLNHIDGADVQEMMRFRGAAKGEDRRML